jgi:D-tyrosyl-tRNA(Tyr) deacylase
MKAVIQRVKRAAVRVDNEVVGEIEKGLCLLIGVTVDDEAAYGDYLAEKIANLRIFEDDAQKLNRSVKDVDGEILAISNFTLCTEPRKSGNRPSFTQAARPDKAQPLYDRFCEKLQELGVKKVAKGVFGADMEITIIADGPVTIVMDTDEKFKK